MPTDESSTGYRQLKDKSEAKTLCAWPYSLHHLLAHDDESGVLSVLALLEEAS